MGLLGSMVFVRSKFSYLIRWPGKINVSAGNPLNLYKDLFKSS